MTELKIELDNLDYLHALFGDFDCNITLIQKEYGVSVQTVGRHARKEKWISGCRNERRRRAESRNCLLQMTWALMRGAKRAAEEAEKGEACTKELKELAGILQTLAGLEKELGGGTAVQTVQVLMGEGVRELSE